MKTVGVFLLRRNPQKHPIKDPKQKRCFFEVTQPLRATSVNLFSDFTIITQVATNGFLSVSTQFFRYFPHPRGVKLLRSENRKRTVIFNEKFIYIS